MACVSMTGLLIRCKRSWAALLSRFPKWPAAARAEIERIKSFISRQDDGSVRLPYARNSEPLPRRFILCGTTNRDDDLPNDPTGNRRLVSIVLKHGTDVEAYFADGVREQLWAEALYRVREKGERANLPRDLMRMQAERAEQHRERDDAIEDAVSNLPKEPMTMGKVMDELPDRFKNYKQQRIGTGAQK